MRVAAFIIVLLFAALAVACGAPGAEPGPAPDATPPIEEEEFFDDDGDDGDGVESEDGAHDAGPGPTDETVDE